MDASEYAPQVVELPTASEETELENSPTTAPIRDLQAGRVSEEESRAKWLKKLKLLREKHRQPTS